MPPLPPVTQFLMLVCTAVYCLQVILPSMGIDLTPWIALWPLGVGRFMPWQVVTYAFAHASFTHLLFNMLGLWMFGSELELLWGQKRYLQFMLAGVLAGAITFLLLAAFIGVYGIAVGISAALYALLMACAMLFPNRTVMPIVPPIPMKMKNFVLIFGGLSLLIGFYQGQVLVELTHLGGMLGGYLMIQYWRGRPPFGGLGGRGRGGPRRLH
jgi:membrane associated rhomboid family serine protease